MQPRSPTFSIAPGPLSLGLNSPEGSGAGGGCRWAFVRCSSPGRDSSGALPPTLSRRIHDPPRAPHSQPPLGALAPKSPHGRCQSLRSCPAGASECAHFLPARTCLARLERRPAGPPADVFLSPRRQREPAVPPGPKANRRAPNNWHPRQPCPRHARARARTRASSQPRNQTQVPCGLYPARLLYPWDSLGKNTVWIAIPFSRGSSQHASRLERRAESLASPRDEA